MKTPSNWKKSFLTIMGGQLVSLIGSSAVQFSIIWWLASETNSPLMMALSGLMAFLPQMLLGPFAGVMIDRMKRKTVIIAADLSLGLLAAAFALYFTLSDPPYWTACVLLGLRAVGGVFHTPALQSAVPMIIPKDQLVRANGWMQFIQSGAFMLGPVLGAVMFAALPLSVILLSDLVGALVACAAILPVSIPDPEGNKAELPHFFKEMKEGAAVFARDKKLLAITITTTLCMVFCLPLSSYYPLMSSSYFGMNAMGGSVVELMFAGGMLLASAAASLIGTIRRKLAVVHIGLMGYGLTCLICGFLPPTKEAFIVFAVTCLFMGASGTIYNIPYIAYMQENIPPEAQGRAFSLIGSLLSAAMPVGLLISAPVAQSAGVPFWFLISGLAMLLFVALDALYFRILTRREHSKVSPS